MAKFRPLGFNVCSSCIQCVSSVSNLSGVVESITCWLLCVCVCVYVCVCMCVCVSVHILVSGLAVVMYEYCSVYYLGVYANGV